MAQTQAQAQAQEQTQTNASTLEDIAFSISKAKLNQIKSEINCMNWKNLNTLISELIELDCEIFGGAARDIFARDHWATKFYEEFLLPRINDTQSNTTEQYDEPTCHPESYEGRTLLPKDLDLFIKGEANFEKVKKYLINKYKVITIEKSEGASHHTPYFIEKNPKLAEVLLYHHFILKNLNYSVETRRMIEILKHILPAEVIDKIFPDIIIHIDIIVLKDNWKQFRYYLNEMCPPFDNPDFRCNQISLVKDKKENLTRNYTLKVNWNLTEKSDGRHFGSLFKCVSAELSDVQLKMDNLKIVIEDIINKRAIPVSKNISAHRIIKMQAKGYTIDLAQLLSNVHTKPLNADDLCSICLEDFSVKKIAVKPCVCASVMHPECWAFLMKTEMETNYTFSCPSCRKMHSICETIFPDQFEPYTICRTVNMLCALEHHREDIEKHTQTRYVPIVCRRCIADIAGSVVDHRYNDEDDEDDDDDDDSDSDINDENN